MILVPIESLEDPRVADYREVRDADLRGRRGVFLAEGEVVLRVLLARGRFAVRSVFLARSRLEGLRGALEALGDRAPVFVAEQRVLDGVVGFGLHRGVLGAGERGEETTAGALLAGLGEGPRLVVGLVGLTNHDNVGSALRNAAAFGADAVLLDPATCDPLYRKAIRVSVGAALFVPFGRAGGAIEMITALRAAGFFVLALTPGGEREVGRLGPLPGRVALLAGSEGPGLPAEALALADARVRIPMAGGFDSLNVATATGIALHAVRALPARSPAQPTMGGGGTIE